MAEKTCIDFPVEAVLPKAETGADKFVEKNPKWDGRGVTVAIFDSGVDPGAAGLQTTSDGRPKIIDVVDCTGSGDVETTEIREIKQGVSTLVGLSGRTLTLGQWSCPSGKFHLGIKRLFELFPEGLVKRVKSERLESFKQSQRSAEADIQQKMSALEQSQVSKKTEEHKKEKKDFEATFSGLSEQMEQYSDPGPVIDCIVFNDGAKWRAVVDAGCTGDLTQYPLLTNFRDERQFSTFSRIPGTKPNSVLLNFAVNVYEDGRRLSIVVDSSAHGTHVAGIVAANFPEKPALNGVAPGAQIVSCKIGDTRLGSMETGTGLMRALIVAKENACDLINLSYGESYLYPNIGRFVEVASEFVNRHNIIFVSSAGNNGPSLSTVGAPGGTTSAIISVGAYVSPGMMEVEYSSLEPLPIGTNYTWSSRGPTIDGFMGVAVCAPGGAIAPVPNWTLQNKQLMNGTSMSSPNCCGGIALLLSALKSERAVYSPHSIRRAIENTAVKVDGIEPFAIGHGLLQVPQAYDYLRQFESNIGAQIPFNVSVASKKRGVYLRNLCESQHASTFHVSTIPQFHPDCDNTEQVSFEMDLALSSTVPWIKAPKQLVVNGQGGVHPSKGFDVVVDAAAPTLPAGAHFGLVQGFDSSAPGRGPMFHLPVTVIKPERVQDDGEFRFKITGRTYSPGLIDRHFIHVPDDATSAKLTFKTYDLECSHLVVLHVLQLVPGVAPTGRNEYELEKYIRLKPHHEVVEYARVKGGLTMEVCLCKFWSSVGSCSMDVEIEFHSVVLGATTLTVSSAGPEALAISTPLRAESLSVAAKATRLRKFYPPSKHTIRTLDPARYLLPQEQHIYELELHYSFEQGEKESVKCQPVVHGLSDLLYDSPFESQMWMVFDSNKQLMGTGDALHEYPVTLPKGKYTLRLSVRHDKRDALDKLKTMVVSVDFGLAKDVALNVYSTLYDALSSGSKYSGGMTQAGFRSVLYVSPPADKVPGAKAGDLLLGKMTLAKTGEFKEECSLQYIVGKEAESEEEKEEVSRTDAELLNDAVRDAQLGRLKKLREEKKWAAFDALAQQISQDHSGYLPLLKEILLKEEADGEDGQDVPRRRLRCAAAVRAANAVIEACDVAGLAAHYGVRTDSEDSAQKTVRKEMDKKKENLVEAILIKGERLAALMEPAPGRAAADGLGGLDEGRSLMQELEDTWEKARQWIAPKDAKLDIQVRYAMLSSSVERRCGRPGAALADLLRVLKSKEGASSKRVMEELRDLSVQLGWKHWQEYYEETLLKCFPGTYPLF